LFGRSAALVSLLDHQLSFFDHVHECDADERGLRRVKRFASYHRTRDPLSSSMVLFHDIIHILHLTDGRAVLFVRALDRGFMGVTAVHGDRLRDPIPADRLLEKPQRGFFIPMLGEQTVNGLAVLIYRARARAPLTLDLDILEIDTLCQQRL
jgi:hypothetical protein